MNGSYARIFLALMGAGSSVLGLASMATAGPKLPVEAFFQPPALARPQLSPDGSKIAFLFPVENKMALGYLDRETQEANMIVRGKDESILTFFWKGNERLVFTADVGGNESFFIGVTDLGGKKVRRIAESSETRTLMGSVAGLLNRLRNDPRHIVVGGAFTQRRLAPGEFRDYETGVFRLDVVNGDRDRLHDSLDRREVGYLIDEAGKLRGRLLLTNEEFRCFLDEKGGAVRIFEYEQHGYAEEIELLGFDASGKKLFLLSRRENDRGSICVYNTETKKMSKALFTPPEGELVQLVFNHDRSRLLGAVSEFERRRYHWFDQDRARLQASFQATFAGKEVDVVSTSDDETIMLLRVSSDRDIGSYFVYDADRGRMDPFKSILDLDPEEMRPMEAISYEARDGLEIHGYLTRPTDGAMNGPLIIYPHGGPFGVRDSWVFQRDVQFMANRGYAVLQVNYRGSGGYGREFIDKGRYQWGRAMQDDLTDAVKWAIEEGIADPERVAIAGASYGGYAVLAGLTFTPELYRCGINYVGASDLDITFSRRGQNAGEGDFNYRDEWVGPDSKYRAERSPVNYVEQIRVPLLNAYGENDPRVVIDHWYRLKTQLLRNNIPFETIIEKEQGHGFRETTAEVAYYTKVEEFLAKHMPTDRNQ